MYYITPTARLAYYLKHTLSEGSAHTLSEWLECCWDSDSLFGLQLGSEWKRLTALQSTLIWQEIIQSEGLPLLRPHAVVSQVQQAWQWLQQWQIPLLEVKKSIAKTSERKNISDMELFLKWAEIYEARCLENHWIDEVQVPTFLCQHRLQLKNLHPICLYGFDHITPQLQSLFAYLRSVGLSIEEKEYSSSLAESVLYESYPDPISEWRAAAAWAQNLLADDPQKTITIGIVIPELANDWLKIQGVFIETFMPLSLLKGHFDEPPPFNLDAGLAFNQYPLISMTLTLLRSLMRKLPYQEMSSLIRSVFWSAQTEELSARAQLTVTLADKGYQQLGLGSVVNFLQGDPKQVCPELLRLMRDACLKRKEWPKSALPSEWVLHLKTLFSAMDWPNGRALNSSEYQIWQRWLELVDELGKLDPVTGVINYQQLLNIIQTEAQGICFQAETPPTSLQVMGILETSGMSFDYLWVCGLSANAWPPAAQPNPFIPPALQRHYGLPHASYEQELAFAQQFTEHWKQAASHLIFSYAKTAGGQECLPSPLIEKEWAKWNSQEARLPLWKTEIPKIVRSVSDDDVGLPIHFIEAGSRLVGDQAECPFRAYANHRLGLNRYQLREPQLLGNAMKRGIIVHRVLQLFWDKVRNQKNLKELSGSDLNEYIHNYVEKAIVEEYSLTLKSNAVPDVFIEVEKNRLKELIFKWLEKEKSREYFSVVQLEKAVYFDFDGVKINLRIDRIDKSNEGQYVIIDYKTAKPPSAHSDDERLLNPQMPLYAMTQPDNLSAALFAQVSGEFTGFSGWVSEMNENYFPKLSSKALVSVALIDQIKEWKEKVNLLTAEFKKGYAKVDPYPTETACRYCDLHLLCRIKSEEFS